MCIIDLVMMGYLDIEFIITFMNIIVLMRKVCSQPCNSDVIICNND